MFWLYFFTILFSLSGILAILFLALRKLTKPIIVERVVETERVVEKSSASAIERAVREGMKAALREMESEKQAQFEMMDKLKNANKDMGVYASTDDSEAPVKRSGGNLIPFGLSMEEKKALEMFYGD